MEWRDLAINGMPLLWRVWLRAAHKIHGTEKSINIIDTTIDNIDNEISKAID